MQVGVALVLIALSPPDWFSRAIVVMMGIGLLQATLWFLQTYAISRETDISRIVPVLESFPLLVLIISVVFLGESLTSVKWIAVLMVIGGAILASWHQALPGERLRFNRSFFAIMGAMVATSLMVVLFKVASADLSIVQMVATAWLFAAPGHFLAMRLSNNGVQNVRAVFRSRSAVGWVGLTQIAMVIAIFSGLAAMTIGPLSLSTAIMSTRPVMLVLWVLASGISFKRAASGGAGRGPMRSRVASASLVTAGVGAMAF
jgi:drug/metabolite transporter (DMT)-like permease